MQKSSTQSTTAFSIEANLREDVAPRKKTIEFLRQFARSCQSLNLSDNAGSLNLMVLN